MPANVANRDHYEFAAGASDTIGVILTQQREIAGGMLEVRYENPGPNALAIKIQDSADNTSWADVTGSSKTVVVGGIQTFTGYVRKYLRLVGSGETRAVVEISPDVTQDVVQV